MATPAGTPVALVLAAGKSERLGSNKLLEVVDGRPIIEWTLHSYLRSTRVHEVILVHGPGDRERYDWLKSIHTHLVENPHPEKGMISSIRAGLSSAWAQERDFLLHPGDVPFVKPELIDRIAREHAVRNAGIVLPAYRGLGGHPGMYAASLRGEFFLHGDRVGTREILVRHRDKTVRLHVPDPDVCFDVDTAEDLKAAADAGARWARVERLVEERGKGRPRSSESP